MESFVKDVKDSFDKMTSMSNANEAHSQVFEMLVATLLNLEQFDFILSRSDKCWNMVCILHYCVQFKDLKDVSFLIGLDSTL